jgi:endoglucanase
VSLAGAEFGVGASFCDEQPGQFGKDYTYNSERTVAYFAGLGITPLRVPFRWERVQPRPGEALDGAELGRLRAFVGWAKRHGATVILDVHNFGCYRLKRGGKVVEAVIDGKVGDEIPVTRDHFADLWRRLSAAFRDEPAVEAYALMNEPHDMDRSDWKAISRAAVAAVRAGGDAKLVIVPGESWSNSDRFVQVNGPTPWVEDPAGNVAYEAHCYFDSDYSGQYKRSYDEELAKDNHLDRRGVRRLVEFAGWCAVNGVRGFLGEFGVPGNDPRWLRVLGPFLDALDRVGVDSCYWAAGNWWPESDLLSIQPRDDDRTAAPQLEAIRRRAGRSSS